MFALEGKELRTFTGVNYQAAVCQAVVFIDKAQDCQHVYLFVSISNTLGTILRFQIESDVHVIKSVCFSD